MFPTLWMSVLWASETAPRRGHLPPAFSTPGSWRQVSITFIRPPHFASSPKDFHFFLSTVLPDPRQLGKTLQQLSGIQV